MILPSHLILSYSLISIVKLSSCLASNINCKLENKVVRVMIVDGKFVRVHDHHHNDNDDMKPMSDHDNRNTRNLRKQDALLHDSSRYRYLDLDINNVNNTNYDNNEKVTTHTAHECQCAVSSTPAYCLRTIGNENFCEANINGITRCYHSTASLRFIRSTWTMLVLGYIIAIIYFISTDAGRLTVRYACSRIFCRRDGNNSDLMEIVLEEDLRRRMAMRSRSNRRGNITYLLKTKKYFASPSIRYHSANEDDTGKDKLDLSQPTTCPSTPGSALTYSDGHDDVSDDSLVISNDTKMQGDKSIDITLQITTTKSVCPPRIQSNQNMEASRKNVRITTTLDDPCADSDYNGETCSICILPIEDGDRIGALRCDHKFHVDCLKEWIKRRNVCPLCQSPDIAEVRRAPTAAESSSNNGGITTRTSVDGESSIQNLDLQPSVTQSSRVRNSNRAVVPTVIFPANPIRQFAGTTQSNESRVPTAVTQELMTDERPADSFYGWERLR